MPPDDRDPTSPAAWLRRARSNPARSRAYEMPEVLYEDLCFDAQQAADALTQSAVGARYPGLGEPVTAGEHARAVELSERVVHWAEAQIAGAAPSSNPVDTPG